MIEWACDHFILWKIFKQISVRAVVRRGLTSNSVMPSNRSMQALGELLGGDGGGAQQPSSGPTTVTSDEEADAARACLLARLLTIQEARLAAEDGGEKVVALMAPLVAGLMVTTILSFADATGAGAESLRLMVPSARMLAVRCLLNVVFEVLTDLFKNGVFWRVFAVLPARVHPVLSFCDVVQGASAMGLSAGYVLIGVALAALLRG